MIRALIGLFSLAALAVIGCAIFVGWVYQFADRSAGPMIIAARRGDVANWPENTLPALASAARQNADAIEFDIRRSANGTFHLMHDAIVDRTTNGVGPIVTLSDASIDALTIDGGLGYDGQQGLGVPTLDEAFELLAAYDGLLLLDAKGDETEHRALAEMLADRNLLGRVMMSVRNEYDVAAVHSVAPIKTYGRHGSGADADVDDSPLPFTAWFSSPRNSAILESWQGDESIPMDRARRWGVEIYITNDLAAAQAWASGQRE